MNSDSANTSAPSVYAAAPSAPVYWKVLSHDHKHRDYTWVDGLNVLQGPFNRDSEDCAAGRLYYCEQADIAKYFGYGDHIQRIYEPVDDPLFQCVQLKDKKGANRLVLGAEKWSLYDPQTYVMLGLTIYDNCEIINMASANGRVDVLNALKKIGMQRQLLVYSCKAMDRASTHGHIAALQWWFDSGLELEYSNKAMDVAAKMGHVDVLQWWLSSGLECKYSYYAMDVAAKMGNLAVLQWWFDSGLERKYSNDAMDWASFCGDIAVLQWWFDSGLERKYSDYAMDVASAKGYIAVLQWWFDSGLELKYSDYAMDEASANGRHDVIEWWLGSGLELKDGKQLVDLGL